MLMNNTEPQRGKSLHLKINVKNKSNSTEYLKMIDNDQTTHMRA